MSTFFMTYMALWGSACLVAVLLMFRLRSKLELFQQGYWDWLFQGWKVTTFVFATTGMVVIAPYTGDYTWDYIDALFMCVLAYATAPWVMGSLYLTIIGKRSFAVAYISLCAWMFSASWSHDLYLIIRDGDYPGTWLVNMGASSFLYVLVGLIWSLEYVEGKGVVFGFMNENWPSTSSNKGFTKILWYILLFMIPVVVVFASFLF